MVLNLNILRMYKIVYSVLKKKSRTKIFEDMVIHSYRNIPSSRLPQIPSSQTDNDIGYSSIFDRNTFPSENIDTKLPN